MSEVACREFDGILHLANDRIGLTVDSRTGRWLTMQALSEERDVMSNGDMLSPILLTVGGRTAGSRGFNQMFTVADAETVGLHWNVREWRFETDSDDGVLTVGLAEGPWRVDLRWRLRPGSARVERSLRIEYTGPGEALLRHFLVRLPCATPGPDSECFIEAPGHAVRPMRRVSTLGFGPWGMLSTGAFCDSPAWKPPLLGLHHPPSQTALQCWAWTETEPFFPLADRTDRGILFSHRVYLADRFTRGHSLEWRAQYVELFEGPWMKTLERFQGFYDEVGLIAPRAGASPEAPERSDYSAVNIFEAHVGTLTQTRLAPYPDYAALILDLPRIRERGFDVVYLMPHVPYPGYSVIDYLDMGIQQGDEAGFRVFVARAHEVGLKVFIDVTLHGVMDRRARRMLVERDGRSEQSYPVAPSMPDVHPYLEAHPEWFSRSESGEVAMTYTYAFDHANPSWQEFMVSVFRHYVEEYQVDGFRVDSHTWNFFPNWARGLAYPASASIYGSVALFKRVLPELQRIRPDVALYTETAGPLLHGSHLLGYGYDEAWLLHSIFPVASRRGFLCHFLNPAHLMWERMDARELALWLAQRRLAMPRGAVKVHNFDSHDSYWRAKEFRRSTFGTASPAILALLAFIDGGFMDFNGADEGMEELYRRILQLRRTQPALKRGDCDYLAIEPDDRMVFAALRRAETGGQTVIVVVNLDSAPASTRLGITPEVAAILPNPCRVFDLLSESCLPPPRDNVWTPRKLRDLRVSLPGYGALLLEFQHVV